MCYLYGAIVPFRGVYRSNTVPYSSSVSESGIIGWWEGDKIHRAGVDRGDTNSDYGGGWSTMTVTPNEKGNFPCPVCDSVFQSAEAVKGHWGGKRDGDHTGNFHEAYAAYLDAESTEKSAQGQAEQPQGQSGAIEGGEQSPDKEADTKPTEDPSQRTDGGGEAEPAVFPDGPENGTTSDTAETNTGGDTPVECPRCGSTDHREPDTVLETYSAMLTEDQKQLLQSSDYVCGDCGGVFDES